MLGRGDLLGIYPEGTRSPDGRLYRGRTGLARMALEAHVPVIPVVMVDTDTVMPIGARIPRVGRVGIVIGEPLDFSRFSGMEGDRYILRSVTDEIMVALQRLGEQTYDDVYARRSRTGCPPSAALSRPSQRPGRARAPIDWPDAPAARRTRPLADPAHQAAARLV